MLIRRVMIAVLSTAALALSVLGGAAPASAADLGTVTVSYNPSPMNYTVSPSTLNGSVGDTFTLLNTMISSGAWVSLVNDSGSVTSSSSGNCIADGQCNVVDSGGTATGVFTVSGTGLLTVRRTLDTGASYSTIGTITLSAGGSNDSGSTNPALAYPTATLDPNGGTCTGTLQFTKYNNQNGTITTPTDATCTRTQYRLAGWARSADSTSAVWTPGESVPIGDESFTVYAVWSPVGAEITYDSNVGDLGQCLNSSGVNVAPGIGRASTTVTTTTLAGAAPCRPEDKDLVLSGWATSGTGSVVYQLGESLTTAKIAEGSVLRLFAVWQPTLTITCTQARALPLWTFSCTDFGDVPVGWEAVISVVVSNQSARAQNLVAQPLNTADVNGALVAKPKEGDCNASVAVPPKGSCTLHFSWTPERAGSLSAGTSITVCRNGNLNSCYRTALNSGLRGNAYLPAESKPDS